MTGNVYHYPIERVRRADEPPDPADWDTSIPLPDGWTRVVYRYRSAESYRAYVRLQGPYDPFGPRVSSDMDGCGVEDIPPIEYTIKVGDTLDCYSDETGSPTGLGINGGPILPETR